jgi:hypothetical protein
MDDKRIARRERINDIFASVWDPVPDPVLRRPLTPDDHLRTLSFSLSGGTATEDNFIVQEVAKKRGVEVANEYVRLLREEALAERREATDSLMPSEQGGA